MPKQKKKRTKIYSGQGARVEKPTVIHINAVKRSKLQQWWLDRKRVLKPVLIGVGVVVAVVWLLIELVRAVLGGSA